jgi:hypothetical protein
MVFQAKIPHHPALQGEARDAGKNVPPRVRKPSPQASYPTEMQEVKIIRRRILIRRQRLISLC